MEAKFLRYNFLTCFLWLKSHMNPTHLPMAVWIHSSVRSFLSSTVRLKLSPVVPFTDDKEMLDHTKLWACIVHKLFPLQLLAHLMLDSLVPTARPFLPLLFQTGDCEGLGSRLLTKVCLLCHVIVYVVMVSMLFYSKITVKHNFEDAHKHIALQGTLR